ncbi:P27 family phage terminase small subunit [Brevibacillus laterosporus]|uniref:P27 family phage terminase small subunit n=2 Tax=Brevibacillus laterosporus TaxID=1465 RepID=A0AAP3DLL2_BRELA|nr:P27 family phage terminase small subunit [Brevibacillus laterosporus]MCR8983217.1 P27 family phage terminase small subunit [Brevibacillus laterosporus]MCZ0810373.1 P27 family phage terminase small subunit [Brevibacillus laterosporus]MCZ0829133.1 P27 family phage terminase small subunit [Brevibacillus laterosporus]
MDEKKIKALKNELLKRTNKKSKVHLEKVDRYINLVEIYYSLDDAIKDYGIMITTINGSQEFTKPNPAIAEKNKINSSLIALGKDLGLDVPMPLVGSNDSKSDLI